ncbi:hypothetical protein [Serratia liquefaciens]|uniref:hypothetical protein n=1 Tax=Serratia liquefaciens TaxID=614 RepID=UPI003D08D345
MKLYLDELNESLRIIGHTHLWLRGDREPDPDLPDYFEVISADERELAWWCADSGSWFLTKEVDVITPFSTTQTPNLPPSRELIESSVLGLSILFNC